MRTKPDIRLKDLFKNRRGDVGLCLTKYGLHHMCSMLKTSKRSAFPLNKIKITPRIRMLLDKYMTEPFYFDKKWLVLFKNEDRLMYNLHGRNWDNFVEYMEVNTD